MKTNNSHDIKSQTSHNHNSVNQRDRQCRRAIQKVTHVAGENKQPHNVSRVEEMQQSTKKQELVTSQRQPLTLQATHLPSVKNV